MQWLYAEDGRDVRCRNDHLGLDNRTVGQALVWARENSGEESARGAESARPDEAEAPRAGQVEHYWYAVVDSDDGLVHRQNCLRDLPGSLSFRDVPDD